MTKRKKLTERLVTKINVPCSFGGQISEVAIFVGTPESKHHPIHFQSKFIQDVKGGMVPQAILDSLEKLQTLSIENGVSFQELCKYALSSLGDNKAITDGNTPSTEGNDQVTLPEQNINDNKSNTEDTFTEGNDQVTPPEQNINDNKSNTEDTFTEGNDQVTAPEQNVADNKSITDGNTPSTEGNDQVTPPEQNINDNKSNTEGTSTEGNDIVTASEQNIADK